MAQSNINIRVDEDLKKQFDMICDKLGLTMSEAINIFIRAVINYGGIPFEISTRTLCTKSKLKQLNNK